MPSMSTSTSTEASGFFTGVRPPPVPWYRRVRWPPPRLTALVVALSLVNVTGTRFVLRWRPGPLTYLTAGVDGFVTTDDAYVGTVYDVGVFVWVHGSAGVRIVGSHMRHDRSVTELTPVVGNWCTHHDYPIGGVGDMTQHPRFDVVPAKDRLVHRTNDDPCYFAVLRFVPNRLGTLEVGDGYLVYRVAGITRHAPFDFRYVMNVTHTGEDPRARE